MTAIPLPTPPPDRIFRIALGLLALFGALELSAVGVYYANRARANRPVSNPSVTTAPVATPAPTAAPTTAPVVAPTAAPSAAASATAAASPPSAAALSAADRLLKEATTLRERG